MYALFANIGEWFAAHDLMSAEAGHWVAWIALLAAPLTILIWWLWIADKYVNEYVENPIPANKRAMIVSLTAPVSVPALFALAGAVWVGRKFKSLAV